MAINSEERREKLKSNEWKKREKTTITYLSKPKPKIKQEIVAVIYYLSRHGQLEQPHFIEVPLSVSSPNSLFLSDFIKRLNLLRGHAFANLYSWSSKRSYKNGFVWQDLSEKDLIIPSQGCHGHEFILKGSKLVLEIEKSLSFRSYETTSPFSDSKFSWETNTSSSSTDSSIVYKAITSGESGKNAWTQTGEMRRREAEEGGRAGEGDSSFGRLESSRSMDSNGLADLKDPTVRMSQRWRLSKALMHLIKCTF